MTAQTPVYGIKYIQQGEPIRNTRQALQDNATSIEAALVRGGIAPAGAPDLATLSGRVTVLEGLRDTEANIRTNVTGHNPGDVAHATDTGAIGIWDAAGRWIFYDTKWQTYTPQLSTSTTTNYMTAGNAQLAGRYFRSGRQIACEGQIVLGSTTSFTGGQYGALFVTFPPGYLPFQWSPNGYYPPIGSALINSGAGANMGWMLQTPATPAAGRRLQPYTAAGVAATGTANSPANWNLSAPGHQIIWNVVYETAFEA